MNSEYVAAFRLRDRRSGGDAYLSVRRGEGSIYHLFLALTMVDDIEADLGAATAAGFLEALESALTGHLTSRAGMAVPGQPVLSSPNLTPGPTDLLALPFIEGESGSPACIIVRRVSDYLGLSLTIEDDGPRGPLEVVMDRSEASQIIEGLRTELH